MPPTYACLTLIALGLFQGARPPRSFVLPRPPIQRLGLRIHDRPTPWWQSVVGVAWSPDGKWLAAANIAGMVRVWDTRTWREEATLRSFSERLACLAFSPEGRYLAISDGFGSEGAISLWITGAWVKVRSLPAHGGAHFAFSPSGDRIASVDGSLYLAMWRLPDGERIEQRRPGDYPPWTIAWSPDGRLLSATSADVPAVVSAADGAGRVTMDGPRMMVGSIAFSPDSRSLAATDLVGAAFVWDAATGKQKLRIETAQRSKRPWVSVAYSPDGTMLAISSPDHLRLLDAVSGNTIGELKTDGYGACPLAFSPDGCLLAAGDWSAYVRIFRIRQAPAAERATR